jgi:hypothetical protein
MYFHRGRVFWIGWSLIWAAVWAVVAALSVPRHLCGVVLVYTVKGQQCVGAMPMGNLGLMIIFAVLALGSVAFAFIPVGLGKLIPVGLGKIRRHLAARHPADPG